MSYENIIFFYQDFLESDFVAFWNDLYTIQSVWVVLIPGFLPLTLHNIIRRAQSRSWIYISQEYVIKDFEKQGLIWSARMRKGCVCHRRAADFVNADDVAVMCIAVWTGVIGSCGEPPHWQLCTSPAEPVTLHQLFILCTVVIH